MASRWPDELDPVVPERVELQQLVDAWPKTGERVRLKHDGPLPGMDAGRVGVVLEARVVVAAKVRLDDGLELWFFHPALEKVD